MSRHRLRRKGRTRWQRIGWQRTSLQRIGWQRTSLQR